MSWIDGILLIKSDNMHDGVARNYFLFGGKYVFEGVFGGKYSLFSTSCIKFCDGGK